MNPDALEKRLTQRFLELRQMATLTAERDKARAQRDALQIQLAINASAPEPC